MNALPGRSFAIRWQTSGRLCTRRDHVDALEILTHAARLA
jgi:hypothetical protein